MKHDRLHSQLRASPGIVLLEDQDLHAYHLESSQVSNSSRVELPLNESKSCRHHFASLSGSQNRSFRFNERSHDTNSIDTIPFSYGALRSGGTVNVLGSRFIGLPLNWLLIGFFDGAVASIVSPLLNKHLGYSRAQMNAVQALFGVPRSLKALVGYLSDCVPINRQRRKPYMIIGWIILMMFMVTIAFFKDPTPYTRGGVIVYNDAASQGPRYVMTIFAGMFGHLLCTVACEGMMIEFAHREGKYGRGRVQCLCLFSRFAGEALGGISTSLALNSEQFGGAFATAVPLQVIFVAYALLAVGGLAVTLFAVKDEKASTTNQRFISHIRRVWDILQKPTMWQIAVAGFFISVGISFRPFESTSAYVNWLGATTLTLKATSAMSSAGVSMAAGIYLVIALDANWRLVSFAAVSAGLLTMGPVEMLTVYDVFRSLATSLIALQIGAILDGVIFVVYLLVVVEVSEPGYEAVTYGILTTIANLAIIVTSMVNNLLSSGHVSSTDLQQDNAAVREHVMREFVAKYALRVVAMLFVWLLLPRQKRELRRRALESPPNLVPPIILFAFFALLFGTCITSDMMAVFPSTSCLKFAGGSGC